MQSAEEFAGNFLVAYPHLTEAQKKMLSDMATMWANQMRSRPLLRVVSSDKPIVSAKLGGVRGSINNQPLTLFRGLSE